MKSFIILGLSNVGKSSIFNYIVGENINVVWDEENTTIDYLSYNFQNLTLIDTSGLHNLLDLQSVQSKEFYKNSDVVVYVVDCRRSDFSLDRLFLSELIKRKEVWLVFNFFCEKVLPNLPYHKIFYINKNFFGEHMLKENFDLSKFNIEIPTVVLLGASNVGKSTLFNAIVGSERSVVKNEIGTTRDNVKHVVGDYIFIDTAGFRSTEDALDKIVLQKKYSVMSRAFCLVFVIDGSVGFTRLDKCVMDLANDYGICSMLVVNKKDALCQDFSYQLRATNVQMPLVYVSALNKQLNNFWYMLNSFTKKSKINYFDSQLIAPLNSQIKNMELFDKKNRSFSLKSLKFLKDKPFLFMYNSYFELAKNSEKHLIKCIKYAWKIYGFRVVLKHKR